jgi:RimJ/RimL family protein N-acetyltransferase
MTCTIVPIAEEHIEGFRAAVDRVARERRWLAFLAAPDLASAREFVLANLRQGAAQFVALDEGGAVVGWCDIIPDRSRPVYRHCGTLGIGLVDGHRGQGLGTALLRTTLAAALAQGLTRIALAVRADNERARRLYEKIGFVHEGRLRNHMLVDGVYYDTLLMALVV